ncbi:hypothetical protein [Levilactobacillus acidifarinae]|uniref:Uncharacterized protein n=1 Tax=Levilactobacillus acidifarinae DSM 19394 = JCM 15949 TaxID=1423715 RepID=A0A0R1LL68_9LACO|nr:hypothetical protein [Levilactobacillus acidifarinae]KRK94243.1 hypothetical protein FD25_GL000196 [Levilactobacillus acidifarinae DSM 19394]GEO70534.1 hypothetical protein LAC03_24440 [Levilactobacillus acidifarinae]
MYVGKKVTWNETNFLASEKFTSFPTMVDDTNAAVITDELGHKVIPAGTVWPSNDAKAKGILLNGADVNEGPQMTSLLVGGWLLGQNLPVAPSADAMKAMTAIHFKDADALATTTSTTQSGTDAGSSATK